MAGERLVILDPEDHDTAVGVGEAGDLMSDLVANGTPVARPLSARRTFEQRLAVVVLPFVSGNQLAQLCLGESHGASDNVTRPRRLI